MAIRLQVDVGFGDQVVPAPMDLEFPAIFAESGPIIRSCSPETVIAEKFHALVVLGMSNSRMKDYYDIWMLSRSFCFHSSDLREAVQQTFAKRQTAVPESEPVGLTSDFFSNDSKLTQWKGFRKKQKRMGTVPELADIVRTISGFLLPVVADILSGSLREREWNSEQGWNP